MIIYDALKSGNKVDDNLFEGDHSKFREHQERTMIRKMFLVSARLSGLTTFDSGKIKTSL